MHSHYTCSHLESVFKFTLYSANTLKKFKCRCSNRGEGGVQIWQWLRLRTSLIFHCLTLLGTFCYATVYAMHSSWTYQCPFLCPIHLSSQQKVSIWCWHVMTSFYNKSRLYFIVFTLIAKSFLNSCWFVLVENKALWMLWFSDNNWGAQCK